MAGKEPVAELEPQFSSPDATPTPWAKAHEHVEQAKVYWLTTVRPDGRPHVTPLVAVWLHDALYFCTGESERKAKNLARNAHCVVTTGCNTLAEGLDLVIEGDAVRVSDGATLQRLSETFSAKYDPPFDFDFTAGDDTLHGEGGTVALVFEVEPRAVFGFAKGEPFSQTRWRF